MPTRHFRIKSGNISNSQLTITKRGDADTRKKYVIIWKVTRNAKNITSITSIDLKTSPNSLIFKSLKPTDPPENKRWKGVIADDAPPGNYCYSIFWNTTPPALVPYKHDPKIAVMPSINFSRLIKTIVLMVFGLFGLLKLFSFGKRNKAEK